MKKSKTEIKQKILNGVKEYYEVAFSSNQEFIPGKSKIPYAGRVFDERELVNLIDASLDFWLTYGRFSKQFEQKLASFLGVKYCLLVNSGSSANLLAFMALTSNLLEKRKIERGDEVITVAAGFPTTVAPIIQYGAIPVFLDVDLKTANVDVSLLEQALSQKTKVVMLAHTLGNPFNVKAVKDFCLKHNLWLIEDNCDALGSIYDGQLTGSFGDVSTSSFYPPHHMTMGEGGAVYTNNAVLKRILLSMRDWGRDCRCPSGIDNTCGQRFEQSFGELPFGYDHKYVYSHFGYNLKVTDMQAAIGCAQLEKLPAFIRARKRNWKLLRESLGDMTDVFILPKATENSEPSWFGFLLTLKEKTAFNRDQLVNHLEEKGIQTRMLFGGNLVRQPCFNAMRVSKSGFRVVGHLKNTDKIMKDSFWLGVYPGMSKEMIDFMVSTVYDCVNSLVLT